MTALDIGLVHGIVAVDALDAAITALTHRLLAQPGDVLRAAKRTLIDGADLPLDAAIRLEARLRSRLIKA
jgi:enoyl-CoA hydratase/carnithine racemase